MVIDGDGLGNDCGLGGLYWMVLMKFGIALGLLTLHER